MLRVRGTCVPRSTISSKSIYGQIPIQLPLADIEAVLVPLLRLGFHIAFVDMLAQGVLDDFILFQRFDGLPQVAGIVSSPARTLST